MLPKVIMHNSVSLDGSVTDFEVNMELHYRIVGGYNPDVMLVGSGTAKKGIELFMEEVPPESKTDFKKPEIKPGDKRPLWAIPDSRGIMKGLMHVLRTSGYCRDVIVFVSEKTPKEYIDYLMKRNYDYFAVGENHVDYRKALEVLSEKYGAKTVVNDAGPKLNDILLDEGLVDEISLLVSPELVGGKGMNLFRSLKKSGIKLELLKSEVFDSYISVLYKVLG